MGGKTADRFRCGRKVSDGADPGNDASDLEEAILSAYENADQPALIRLYRRAADRAEAEQNIDQAAFFLTYAWIYALEQGDDDAVTFWRRLADWGRVS